MVSTPNRYVVLESDNDKTVIVLPTARRSYVGVASATYGRRADRLNQRKLNKFDQRAVAGRIKIAAAKKPRKKA